MRKQYHFWPGEQDYDAWDVDRLIELSRDLPVDSVSLDAICEIDTGYWFDETHVATVRGVVEHIRLIDEVDPSHPILMGPDGRVMDGMHRVARALLEGGSSLPARRFPELPEPDHRSVRPEDLPYD